MFERIGSLGARGMRFNGKSLYALARNSQGDIREILVRCSGWKYFTNDLYAHLVVDGAGKGFTNVWDLRKATYDKNWREGRVIVSLLGGYGLTPSEQRTVNSGQLRKDGPEKILKDPPNEKQLNSVTVMLAILCLGLSLTVNEIKVLGEMEFVPVYGQLELTPQSADADSPPFSGAKEPAETLIRSWTAAALEEMKNGLYPSINPELAERPIMGPSSGSYEPPSPQGEGQAVDIFLTC